MRSMDMDFPHTRSTFDETIPSMYNQNRLYVGGITMCAPKRILTLSAHDYKKLLRFILEYRNELMQENRNANIYDDIFFKLLYKAK